MDLYWLRKTLRVDEKGHPYRGWGQKRLDPVKRYLNAFKKSDNVLCLALIDAGALGVNDWLDDGRRRANKDDERNNPYAWDSRFTPLHKAARLGDIDLALDLIERGADVNATTLFRQTPLHSAARAKCMPLLALFIEMGGSLDQPTSSRSTFVDDTVGYNARDLLGHDTTVDLEAHRPWLAKRTQERLLDVADRHRGELDKTRKSPTPAM